MAERVLEISKLHKAYGDHKVLNGVDLDLDGGDVISIIGSSGSGKTTLLRCVNLLEEFQEGVVKIDGREIGYSNSKGKRSKVSNKQVTQDRALTGMVFQSFNLFPHLSAAENIMLALRKVQKKSKRNILLLLIKLYLAKKFSLLTQINKRLLMKLRHLFGCQNQPKIILTLNLY